MVSGKAVKAFNSALKRSKTVVDHHQKVINGMNSLIEKQLIRIEGNVMLIYPEIWGDTEAKHLAFIRNGYRYFRLKLHFAEGTTVYIKDIETGQFLGVMKDSVPSIIK